MIDSNGRLVVGPLQKNDDIKKVNVPDFLQGPQITLFGPPDTVKMSINAMNFLHHKMPNEADIVLNWLRNQVMFRAGVLIMRIQKHQS